MMSSMSRIFFFFSLLVAFFFSFASAAALPVEVDRRDVWVPPITYPHAGTVWKVGQYHNVTWDTSTKPDQVTNPLGRVQLRKDGLTQRTYSSSFFPSRQVF